MYPGYNSAESDKQYSQLIKNNKGGVNLATIIYQAKQHGVEVRAEPNTTPSKDSSQPNDHELYIALKKKRRSIADELDEPAFKIFSNKVLDDIVKTKPQSLDSLQTIRGIGKKKIELFGKEIVEMVKKHIKV